jgi:phage-related protein
MDLHEFDVSFYAKEDGDKPVSTFILGLGLKMKAKVTRLIDMLEANGPKLREPYSKHLDDGIFELRAKVGSDISRVLYFFAADKHVILTNGFIKKTSKTPPEEIERAKSYRSDHLSRKEKEQQ